MSNTLKLSGGLRVGQLASDPSNPENGLIYFNTTEGKFKQYENGAFRTVSAQEIQAHLIQDANTKHLDSEIGYTRDDGLRKNILPVATTFAVGSALNNLDDAIGTLANTPTNYLPLSSNVVASHLSAIDSALANAGGTVFKDDVFRIQDDTDNTKQIAFEASNITTSTTRTITMPNSDVVLGDIATNKSNIDTHLNGGPSKHSSSEIDVEVSGNNYTANNLETVIGELDSTIGNLTFTPSNYSDPTNNIVADHLTNIDTALGLAAADANVIKKDGSVDFTADQSMGNFKLTNLAAPVNANDAARKIDVDAASAGMLPKDPVAAATTGNIANLATGAPDSIDGLSLSAGDRVLVWQQTNPIQNGIYTVDVVNGSNSEWSRAIDFDDSPSTEVKAGNSVYVNGGTIYGTTVFRLSGTGDLVVDTDDLNFIIYSRAEVIIDGNGLAKTGNTLSVNVGDGIEIVSDQVKVNNTVTRSNGSVDFTADQSMGNFKLTNLADGTLTGDAVNKGQLDTKISSIVEDLTPQLGGNLDTNNKAILSTVKRGSIASPSNLIEEDYIDSITLSASQTDATISVLTFAHASFEGCEIVYKLKEATSNDVRIGTLRIVTNGTSVVLNDVSTETSDVGISFSAIVNGASINIRYTSGSNAVTMRADVKRFRA